MRTVRPATPDQAICLRNAISYMRKAREWMNAADCPKARDALQAAIKSAEGADRHMMRRIRATHQERQS